MGNSVCKGSCNPQNDDQDSLSPPYNLRQQIKGKQAPAKMDIAYTYQYDYSKYDALTTEYESTSFPTTDTHQYREVQEKFDKMNNNNKESQSMMSDQMSQSIPKTFASQQDFCQNLNFLMDGSQMKQQFNSQMADIDQINEQQIAIKIKKEYEEKRNMLLEQLKDLEDEEWQRMQQLYSGRNFSTLAGACLARNSYHAINYRRRDTCDESQITDVQSRVSYARRQRIYDENFERDSMVQSQSSNYRLPISRMVFKEDSIETSSIAPQQVESIQNEEAENKETPASLDTEDLYKSFELNEEQADEELGQSVVLEKLESASTDSGIKRTTTKQNEEEVNEDEQSQHSFYSVNNQALSDDEIQIGKHDLDITVSQINASIQNHEQKEEQKKFTFVVDPAILSEYEKEKQIEFLPLSLKNFINNYIQDSQTWDVKKQTDLSKIRIKWGSEFNASLPILNSEHLFPDCQDPLLILTCQNEFRKEWDQQLEANEELEEHQNENTKIYRVLNKSVAGTAQREFLDKKIWFRESDTVEDPSTVKEEDNDYYMWISSAPDSFYASNKKYVRGITIVGMCRFGRRKDGQPGCYCQTIVQTDCKINSWTQSLITPIIPGGLIDWGVKFRAFLNKKQAEQKNAEASDKQ